MVLHYYIFGFIIERLASYGKLWFEVFKKEKQDYGKTIFEQNGIRVICINSFASDINRLKQESLKYGIDGFSYSAVGLSKIMDIGLMPTEYLLSPDKKVLYFHNGSLGEKQYSEIFEIFKIQCQFWQIKY